MRSLVLRHKFLVVVLLLVSLFGTYRLYSHLTTDPLQGLARHTVDSGPVEQIVSVSGVTESPKTATLGFPTGGIVALVAVEEGQQVEAGTVLATLASGQQTAALARAEAEVTLARAALQALETGVRTEARAVTSATVDSARAEVARVTTAQDILVENARRALYSNDLRAQAVDRDENSPAPIITGTYRCPDPGTYTLTVYSSNAESGYSMNISGIEDGTYGVSTRQPTSFGACGLQALFSPTGKYQNSEWIITIPNQTSSTYVTVRNALTLALTTRDSAIAAARDAVTVAERRQLLENAAATPEELTQARARVTQAIANRDEIVASIADRSIIAPFAGTVTMVDTLVGETVATTPVITLLSTTEFDIVARIPEVDITKVAVGQNARIRFDANREELLPATITYLAALPLVIDGVSYFEVKLRLADMPGWLRGGLNADIDIVTDTKTAETRIPTRYLTFTDRTRRMAVLETLSNNEIASTTVTVDFIGNDGFSAVSGVAVGTEVVVNP